MQFEIHLKAIHYHNSMVLGLEKIPHVYDLFFLKEECQSKSREKNTIQQMLLLLILYFHIKDESAFLPHIKQ